jgi:hypothetical protein
MHIVTLAALSAHSFLITNRTSMNFVQSAEPFNDMTVWATFTVELSFTTFIALVKFTLITFPSWCYSKIFSAFATLTAPDCRMTIRASNLSIAYSRLQGSWWLIRYKIVNLSGFRHINRFCTRWTSRLP